ncbi:YrhC family protein [Halobacillus shinanisalinarum]|uniref:YrhC family protein n=1 Tax=Halobacillus shinanisalinarum TaxID=2932258 RepID=A0ABY4H0V6_9BACI|nr:YrhC family protein [Halobacillus shinanisalinarum]UOQ93816.1 YrhC family protein [Halobacillus shinanisalinarum]
MKSTEWIESKIADYKRFTLTLLILSSYLYIGVLISIYEYHSQAYLYLLIMIAGLLSAAFGFVLKLKKLRQHLLEE